MATNYSIFKSDDEKRLVFGWASVSLDENGVQLVDKQGDMIDPEDLEETAYNHVLKFRSTGEEHIGTKRHKGKLVESCVFTEEKQRAIGIPENTIPVGWWVGYYIDDDEAWEKVKSGEYTMFSVEGKGVRVPVDDVDNDVNKSDVVKAQSFIELLKSDVSKQPETV